MSQSPQIMRRKTLIYYAFFADITFPSQKVDLSRPTVCFVNGVAKLRKDWNMVLHRKSVISFVALPLGGGGKSSTPCELSNFWGTVQHRAAFFVCRLLAIRLEHAKKLVRLHAKGRR